MPSKWERDTSCQCAGLGRMAPCSWCTEDSRICERCGAILDRDDILPSGYCEPCDLDRFIAEAVLAAQSAPEIDPETLALFGLDD